MSLFEWLGESYNPGPVGTVDVGGRGRGNRARLGVLVCFCVAVLFLGLWVYLVLAIWEVWSATGLVGVAVGTVLYLLLGYAVHPKPDTSNIGWAGGLFDHPFRYSDDINRFLIFLTVALWPGRFVSESLVDMVGLVVHASHSRSSGVEVKGPESKAEPGTDTTPEVRIGASGARIVSVTQKRIQYTDIAGQEKSVDLEECSKNWVGWHDDHAREFLPLANVSEQGVTTWNARCVGQRGAMDNPPWAEFMDHRKTRFVFETYEALYAELLGPLMKVGWHTFDTN